MSAEQMDALFGEQWVDAYKSELSPDGSTTGSYGGNGHCQYSAADLAAQGARWILLYSAQLADLQGIPGAVAADQLGVGAQVSYGFGSQSGQTSCSVAVPMYEKGVYPEHFVGVTVYQRTGKYSADEMCGTALKILQANANQDNTSGSGTQAQASASPQSGAPAGNAAWTADLQGCTFGHNGGPLSAAEVQQCKAAGFHEDDGFAANATWCGDPHEANNLITWERNACVKAGF